MAAKSFNPLNTVKSVFMAAKPLIDMQMYYPMLDNMVSQFIALHRTARFLISMCKRYDTATCTAAVYLKELREIEKLFEDGFKIGVKKKQKTPKELFNTVMQLGMTYDYLMYLSILTTQLNALIQNVQAYITYYLVLTMKGKTDVLARVEKLNSACIDDLNKVWLKSTALNESEFHLNLSSTLGLSSLGAMLQRKFDKGKKQGVTKSSSFKTAVSVSNLVS